MKPARPNLCDYAIFGVVWVLLLYCSRSCWAEPTTRPTTRPFDLRSTDAGQLAFTPIEPDKVALGDGKHWSGTYDDDCLAQFDDYRPRPNYWSGRVCLRGDGTTIELSGWREVYSDWSVINFTIRQSPGGTTAEYTVRTPVGMPDATHQFSDRHTAILLLRHPELQWMLSEAMGACGAAYDCGDFLADQLAGDVRVTAEAAERVRVLIDLTDGPCWRNRAKAECALEAMGIDGAKALLLTDRRGLPPQTQLTIDRVLSRWPVLESR